MNQQLGCTVPTLHQIFGLSPDHLSYNYEKNLGGAFSFSTSLPLPFPFLLLPLSHPQFSSPHSFPPATPLPSSPLFFSLSLT